MPLPPSLWFTVRSRRLIWSGGEEPDALQSRSTVFPKNEAPRAAVCVLPSWQPAVSIRVPRRSVRKTGACGEFELNATAGFEFRGANVHHRPHDVRCAGVRRWMGSQCSWKLQKKACRHLSDLTNTVDSVCSEATFFPGLGGFMSFSGFSQVDRRWRGGLKLSEEHRTLQCRDPHALIEDERVE